MSSKLKKVAEELRESKGTELDAVDKGLSNLQDIPGVCKWSEQWQILQFCDAWIWG